MEDFWRLSDNIDGKFTTKDMYEVLSGVMLEADGVFFPWKKLWWKAVSSKVSAFSCKAIRERIPSKENLLKRGQSEGTCSETCSSYLCVVESSNHLHFTCPSIILVWEKIFHWIGKTVLYSSCTWNHFLEHNPIKRKVLGLFWQSTI